jgi:hypothetical protein
MSPVSILQIFGQPAKYIGRYLSAAGQTKDPILRMKLVMAGSISFVYPNHQWGKPLNPILGETF